MNCISKTFCAILGCMFLFMSCNIGNYKMSNAIEQRIIFPQYQVQYDAQTNQFEAMVYFTVDNPAGLSVKLSDKSSISFNKKPLNVVQNDSTKHYFYHFTTDTLPNLLQFCYINDEGNIFENSLIMKKIEIVGGNTITISKSLGGGLNCSGQSFISNGEDEELISCQLAQKGKNPFCFTINILDKHQISINNNMLDEVPVGQYECRFVREMSNSDIKAMDRGGLITSVYLSKFYTLIITD